MGDIKEVLLTTLSASFLSSSENLRYYNTFVDALHENQLLGTKKTTNLQSVVSEINSSLNSSKKRLEALCVLRQLVSQCCTEVFTQNSLAWLRLLIQALQSHDPPSTLDIACELVSEILSHTVSFPELSRDVASSIIPLLIPTLLESKKVPKSALTCLASCMTHYNGACGPFRNKIEAKVVPLLDGANAGIEDVACQCFALLASCGGGGSLGVKHSEAWSALCQRLLGSINDTLTALLQAVQMGIEDTPEPAHRLALMPVPDTEPTHTCVLHSRFSCLIKALSNMLNTHYAATIKVPLDDILQIIFRALSVTPKQIMFHATQERVILCSVLPLIQARAFTLLQVLIESCKSNLIGYSTTISKIFIQTLNWSSTTDSQYGHEKPYSALRYELYKTLSKWAQILGASAGLETIMTDLLVHWVQDVTPQVDSVKLDSRMSHKVDALMMGGGKKRRKHGQGDVGQLTAQRKVIAGANQGTCTAAIHAMRHIVLSVGPFLKAKHHKTLHNLVVPLLLDIHQGAQNTHGAVLMPYDCAPCRQALYQLLLAIVLCPHANTAPPLQCAIRLFTIGTRDEDLAVSTSCTESLAIAEALIHPRTPLLSSPPEPAQRDNTQSSTSNIFGLGFYNNASFGPGSVFSAATQRKEILAAPSRSFQALERPVTSTNDERKNDVEVVSVGSSESEGESENEADADEEQEEASCAEDEEEKEEGVVAQDVIAIDDDSNSEEEPSSVSPLPSTSKVTSTSSSTPVDKEFVDVVTVTSSVSVDSADCLIVSADTSRSTIPTAANNKSADSSLDLNDSILVLDLEHCDEGPHEGSKNNGLEGRPSPSQKRKREENGDDTTAKSAKTNEEGANDTDAMLATFVDVGPDSE